MLVLGIESSCDETGVALFDTEQNKLLAQQLHTQMAMHAEYGGVVPELASRDHIRRLAPLTQGCLNMAGKSYQDIDIIGFTQGPGLGGALLAGASFANALAFSLNKPIIEVHHLEGHLLSPLLAGAEVQFPFIALLVSGGHTQIFAVEAIGHYTLLGESVDDAAGEAFDKTAKLLGLPYPGGAKLAQLAQQGDSNRFHLPRPMLHSGDLNMSFSGLKTAVLTEVKRLQNEYGQILPEQICCDLCRGFQDAVVEVITAKCRQALQQTGYSQLIVAGGVGSNTALREALQALPAEVFFPPIEWCTDNGAMIAYAAAQYINQAHEVASFTVKPRWPLSHS